MPGRPRVVIPGRFSASASALRFRALVTARALSEAVLAAGGEPLTVHPGPPGDVEARLDLADAVLLPGGGDLSPLTYGEVVSSDEVYDVDADQDGFDLAVARWAWATGRPLLAVCRGMQVVNVVLGGTVLQHMPRPHRHVVHPVTVAEGSLLADVVGAHTVDVSCFHHQSLDVLADGLRAVACAGDGTVEAVERETAGGWFLGVQWHPEDTAPSDPAQDAILRALVDAAR